MNDKSDDLILLCIGSLYSGPLTKKYWSASRGKDRYPYPVGYLASRCYGCTNCEMTVGEGCNGPDFTITCDGKSFSGSTPDIALKKFQKEFLLSKSCLTKRKSDKFDGIEFFGFKNIIVRKLLRALVANINASDEHRLLSSTCCNDTSLPKHMDKCPQPSSQLDILAHPSPSEAIRNGNMQQPQQAQYLVGKEKISHALDTSIKLDEHSGKNEFSHEPTNASSSAAPVAVPPENEFLKNTAKKIVNSQYNEIEGSFNVIEGDKDNHALESKDFVGLNDIDQYIPDTFNEDLSPDQDIKVTYGELTSERPPDVQYISNFHSGTLDLDLSNQDITSSMMAVLLPQAVPLLVNSSKEKEHSEMNLNTLRNKDDSHINHAIEFQSVGAEFSVLESEDAKHAMHPSSSGECFDQVQGRVMRHRNTDIHHSLHLECHEFKDILCIEEVRVKEITQPESKMAVLTQLEENSSNSGGRESSETCFSLPMEKSLTNAGTEAEDNALVNARVYSRRKRKVETSLGATLTESGNMSEKESRKLIVESLTSSDFSHSVQTDGRKIKSPKCGGKRFTESLDKKLCVSKEEIKHAYPSVKDINIESNIDNAQATDVTGLGTNDFLDTCERSAGNWCTGRVDYVEPVKDLRGLMSKNSSQNGISNYDLVGCYHHPIKVSSLLVRKDGDTIVICALCTSSGENFKTIFLYRLSSETSRLGAPCFIGHSTLAFPSTGSMTGTSTVGNDIVFHLTPDGKYLAMHGSVKAPCCREAKVECLCQICKYNCSDNTLVRIVQVNFGYVTTVVNLRAELCVTCFLLMEPNLVIVSGEDGTLHVWIMTVSWSTVGEEFFISTKYKTCSSQVDLKRIPNCSSIVLGHNGRGEFLLWDISKRVLLSRYFTSNASIFRFLPVSVFNWQVFNSPVDNISKYLLDATKISLSSQRKSIISELDWKDSSVWLLISTNASVDGQPEHCTSSNPQEQWRLGLLTKNTLMLGRLFDPRVVTMASSGGNGISGTYDGHVHVWDLITGSQLDFLHDFKGTSVSCIATDGCTLAVADCTGQLLVYQSPKSFSEEREQCMDHSSCSPG